MGGLYAPFMLGGLKVSSWMKRLLLRQSPISQAVDTLHTIARVSASQSYTTFRFRGCRCTQAVRHYFAVAVASKHHQAIMMLCV
jgi:hypothetical protein